MLYRKIKYVLWLAVFLLHGCIRVPEREAVETAGAFPGNWTALSASAGKGEVSAWLRSFKSKEIEKLVFAAINGNNDLKATAARIGQARALARIEGSARKPQLDLAPAFDYSDTADGEDDDTGSGWSVPFNLSWEVDVWGRIGNLKKAAQLEADAVQADVHGAVLSLAARTVQGCFELAEARQRVQVVQESIDERSALVDLLQGRFNLGLAQGLDLSLALTDLSDAQAELKDAGNRIQLLSRRLEVLLGRYPSAKIDSCARLPDLPEALPAGIPSELLSRRPDVTAAFVRLRSQDNRLAGARKALLPRVTLAAAGGSATSAGSAQATLGDPRMVGWNLALGLAQPLYAGDRLQADIDLNVDKSEEALHRYRETVLAAFREVEQSLAAEGWLKGRRQALAETVKRTETSRSLAIYSYRNGSVDILTLLDSYRSTLIARTALLDARLQLLNNRVDLYLALGGGV